jgi:aryl carrier-like protein
MMRVLEPERALHSMDLHLASGRAHVGLMAVDWQALRGGALARDPSLSELLSPDEPRPRDTQSAARPSSPDTSLPYLLAQLGQLLRCRADEVDEERSLTELGLDSLLALDLRNRVQRDTAVALPIVGILRSPSVKALAEQLESLLLGADTAPAAETRLAIEELTL